MKKLLIVLLSLTMLFSLVGCSSSTTTTTEETTTEEEVAEPTSHVVGLLSEIGRTEEDLNEEETGAAESGSGMEFSKKYYDTFTSLQLALDSGEVGSIEIPKVVADYMVVQGENITMSVLRTACYKMLTTDVELSEKISTAIAEMKEDGTLDSLIVGYLTSTSSQDAVDFTKFDGAETITFAVTGDLPPFDYVDAAGNAAGFNTAVIAAVAEKLGVNVELIQVDSGARSIALSTGKADVVFWMSDFADKDSVTSIDYSSENLETNQTPENEPEVDPNAPTEKTEEIPTEPVDVIAKPDSPDGTYSTDAFFYDYIVSVTLAK